MHTTCGNVSHAYSTCLCCSALLCITVTICNIICYSYVLLNKELTYNFLMEFVDVNDVRNKRFVVSSIKDLFDNIQAQNIIDFIKETHFYMQI